MMKTCIALLRGINVGGQKKIKMTSLKKLFEDLSFTNVHTYIQSGNVIFNSEEWDPDSVKNRIRKMIESEYGFNAEIIITTNDGLGYIINHNPFVKK